MEANRTRVRWTYAEYARLPDLGSARQEIIADELVVTPAPTSRHQLIVVRIVTALYSYASARDLGEVLPAPTDVLFAEGDYFQPDVLFVSRDRWHLAGDRGIEGPPDLVVEILSPSTSARDRGIKLDRYRLFGVPEYWIVDGEAERVEVWRLAAGAEAAEVYTTSESFAWAPQGADEPLTLAVAEFFPPR